MPHPVTYFLEAKLRSEKRNKSCFYATLCSAVVKLGFGVTRQFGFDERMFIGNSNSLRTQVMHVHTPHWLNQQQLPSQETPFEIDVDDDRISFPGPQSGAEAFRWFCRSHVHICAFTSVLYYVCVRVHMCCGRTVFQHIHVLFRVGLHPFWMSLLIIWRSGTSNPLINVKVPWFHQVSSAWMLGWQRFYAKSTDQQMEELVFPLILNQVKTDQWTSTGYELMILPIICCFFLMPLL